MLRLSPAADLRKKNRAFTLIELIVVIVIIGILAAIAIVGYNAIIANSKKKALNASATQVSKLVQVASADADAAPVGTTSGVSVTPAGGAATLTQTSTDFVSALNGNSAVYTANNMTITKSGTTGSCVITWATVAGGTNAVSCT